jgi:hypothetical protein
MRPMSVGWVMWVPPNPSRAKNAKISQEITGGFNPHNQPNPHRLNSDGAAGGAGEVVCYASAGTPTFSDVNARR